MEAIRFHPCGGPAVRLLDNRPVPGLVRARTAAVNHAGIHRRTGATPATRPHMGGRAGAGVGVVEPGREKFETGTPDREHAAATITRIFAVKAEEVS